MSERFGLEEIEYVARLARLKLSDSQNLYLASQLRKILEYVHKLNELDTDSVEPLAHVVALENVLREDEVKNSLPEDEALLSAPAHRDGMFIVPKVVE